MSAGDEFIMPVSKPDAVAEMHLHALRQISDSLTATNRSLTNLAADVKDVRERVIKIEAKDMDAKLTEYRGECREACAALGAKVEAACVRIDNLESLRDRRTGMVTVGSWFSRSAPWLIGMMGAAMAFLAGSSKGG